ncbi:MAG TPA: SPOR domain-containing protein, partial [Phaeodactylibacter sp.]|nr:SPOR domain-containing protein [Phaeodactylibacter sp.]
YIARSRNPNDVYEYRTTAPRHEGTYYKIQLAAVSNYQEDRFSDVQDIGVLQTEFILARDLYRVLLADFANLPAASRALEKARAAGYSSAYIVEYINGERYGKVRQ